MGSPARPPLRRGSVCETPVRVGDRRGSGGVGYHQLACCDSLLAQISPSPPTPLPPGEGRLSPITLSPSGRGAKPNPFPPHPHTPRPPRLHPRSPHRHHAAVRLQPANRRHVSLRRCEPHHLILRREQPQLRREPARAHRSLSRRHRRKRSPVVSRRFIWEWDVGTGLEPLGYRDSGTLAFSPPTIPPSPRYPFAADLRHRAIVFHRLRTLPYPLRHLHPALAHRRRPRLRDDLRSVS